LNNLLVIFVTSFGVRLPVLKAITSPVEKKNSPNCGFDLSTTSTPTNFFIAVSFLAHFGLEIVRPHRFGAEKD
jgi:hypothetical protein